MKGDKRFLLPKSQVLAKPFKIFSSSRKRRKPRRPTWCLSLSSIWKTPISAATRASRPILSQQKCVCEEPAWQDHLLDTAEQHKRPADSGSLVPQGFTRRHSGLRRDGGFHADHEDLCDGGEDSRGGESAQPQIKIEEALFAANVAKPLAKWLAIGMDDVTAQIQHPLSRWSLQTRRREQVQLAACSTTFWPRTKRKSNAK